LQQGFIMSGTEYVHLRNVKWKKEKKGLIQFYSKFCECSSQIFAKNNAIN